MAVIVDKIIHDDKEYTRLYRGDVLTHQIASTKYRKVTSLSDISESKQYVLISQSGKMVSKILRADLYIENVVPLGGDDALVYEFENIHSGEHTDLAALAKNPNGVREKGSTIIPPGSPTIWEPGVHRGSYVNRSITSYTTGINQNDNGLYLSAVNYKEYVVRVNTAGTETIVDNYGDEYGDESLYFYLYELLD